MLEKGKCHGVKKKLRRVPGHWFAKERVHVALLKRVVRLVLIEVTFEQLATWLSVVGRCIPGEIKEQGGSSGGGKE